jgi:hypothetical protein
MLKFNGQWRFKTPGAIPQQVDEQFFQIINQLSQGRQEIFERFKQTFGAASGNLDIPEGLTRLFRRI